MILKVNGSLQLDGVPRARAYMGSVQVIGDKTWTILELDTEDYDNLGDFDTVNYKFVAPEAGYYLVVGEVSLDSLSTADYARARIWVNGDTMYCLSSQHTPAASRYPRITLCDIIYLAVDDYVQLQVYHNYGANRNTIADKAACFMAVHKLS